MQIINKYKNIIGSRTARERGVRFRYMIQEEAKRRAKILTFWKKYGYEATYEAYGVKRRTLFLWKKKLKEGGGKLEYLNIIKRTPKNTRKRIWDTRILEELKRLRVKHKNLGKEKLHPLLKKYTDKEQLICPAGMTIGRLISDLGGLRDYPKKITGTGRIVKVHRKKTLRKPKDFKATYPGHCIALDTIEIQKDGKRMYVLVAIDLYTRTCFALGTKSHGSQTMAHFFYTVVSFFPYPVIHVLTDNGSEFKKYFSLLCGKKKLTHFHTYPRTPKMNAHCERLNRTLQEDCIDYYTNLLFENITAFNDKFREYITFYNTERVHYAFNNKKTPIQVMIESNYYQSNLPEECKDGWTYTISAKSSNSIVYLLHALIKKLTCRRMHHVYTSIICS